MNSFVPSSQRSNEDYCACLFSNTAKSTSPNPSSMCATPSNRSINCKYTITYLNSLPYRTLFDYVVVNNLINPLTQATQEQLVTAIARQLRQEGRLAPSAPVRPTPSLPKSPLQLPYIPTIPDAYYPRSPRQTRSPLQLRSPRRSRSPSPAFQY